MNPLIIANLIADEILNFSKKQKARLEEFKEKLAHQIPMMNSEQIFRKEQRRREKTVQYEQLYQSPGRAQTPTASVNTVRSDAIKRRLTEANTEVTPGKSSSSSLRKVGRQNDHTSKEYTLPRSRDSFEIVYYYSDYKTALDSPAAGWNAASATELHTKHRDRLSAILSGDPFSQGSLAKKKKLLQYIRNESLKNPHANKQPRGDTLWQRFQRLDSIEQIKHEPMYVENYQIRGNRRQTESVKRNDSFTMASEKYIEFIGKPKVPTIMDSPPATMPIVRRHIEIGNSVKYRHASSSSPPTNDNSDVSRGDIAENKQRRMALSGIVPLPPLDIVNIFEPSATSYWVGSEVKYNSAKSVIEVTIRQIGSLANLTAHGKLSTIYVSVTILSGTNKEKVIQLCRKPSQTSSVQASQMLEFNISPSSTELQKMTIRFRLFQKGSSPLKLKMDWTMNSNAYLTSQDWTNIFC